MSGAEPTVEQFPNRAVACLMATRPPFIFASIVPILLGLSFTRYSGHPVDALAAMLTLSAGILLHAAVNVLNDYYDALNGTDELNMERIYPFTGGSRFIQNGVLSEQQMLLWGVILTLATTAIGVYLVARTGSPLLWLGLFGLLLGWGYSAPPLRLNSRGLGEIAVLVGFGLIPLGTCLVQTGEILWRVVPVSLPLALLTTNLLYINQFPDRTADIRAGKLHWVARLTPESARWGYLLIALTAWLVLLLLILSGALPAAALIAFLPVPLSIRAAQLVLRHAGQPRELGPAIRMTAAAMLAHGVLLSMILGGVLN